MKEEIAEKFQKLKDLWKNRKKQVLLAGSAALAGVAAITGGLIWYLMQPRFQSLTVELGTDTVAISQFCTRFANPDKVSFVSDISQIDLNQVGDTELTLRQGRHTEAITLTVRDTTAPSGKFLTHVTKTPDYVPAARDFITDLQDLSQVKVYFEQDPGPRKDYSDVSYTVAAEDASGNIIRETCTLSYQWLRESYDLEFHTHLRADDLLLVPGAGRELLNQKILDQFETFPVGNYSITSTSGSKTQTCRIRIADTKGPELELQELVRDTWETASLEDFVVSAQDPSGEVELRLMTEPDLDTTGAQIITVEAEDIYGNITSSDTTLFVRADSTPPDICGLTTIYLEKGSRPDFMAGVYAEDYTDGPCEVSYSAGNIDYNKAGVYYITYTSRDKSGNVATEYRTLEIIHNQADTDALVRSIAAQLGSDPEALRDYVRDTIWYNHNWGGDDPVWYGFTSHGGNCYVHAKCLKALFDLKGITSQLIWTTGPAGFEQSHYWLQVQINGQWKHIDPTPSVLHGRYSLMNDAQRYETLVSRGVNRDWDRSRWPACH